MSVPRVLRVAPACRQPVASRLRRVRVENQRQQRCRRWWFPPFAKEAKDGAPTLCFGGDLQGLKPCSRNTVFDRSAGSAAPPKIEVAQSRTGPLLHYQESLRSAGRVAAVAGDFGFFGAGFFAELAAILFAFRGNANTWQVGALRLFFHHNCPPKRTTSATTMAGMRVELYFQESGRRSATNAAPDCIRTERSWSHIREAKCRANNRSR